VKLKREDVTHNETNCEDKVGHECGEKLRGFEVAGKEGMQRNEEDERGCEAKRRRGWRGGREWRGGKRETIGLFRQVLSEKGCPFVKKK